MATAPASPPDPPYEPKPRWSHCSALVESKWITYSGQYGATGGYADPPTSVDVFDPDREEWTQMITSGTPPSGVVNAAYVAVGPLLYHIGGMDDDNWYNTIHCLDTATKEWRELNPANPQAAPMMKAGMAGISYGNNVVTFGGGGVLPTNRHPGVEYVPHPKRKGEGWTNEVVCYDTEQNTWVRPTITGSPPPACQSYTLTKVDQHRAILFGGSGKDDDLMSPDVYILDMLHWTWTVIPASQTPNHPGARFGHSSVSVYDPDNDPTHPALLIMWGNDNDEILRDSWIFHLNQQQWRKVILPETLKGRMYHTSVVIHSSPKIRIVCFGGLDAMPEGALIKGVPIAQTTIVELSCSGGHPAEWIVTDVRQLGQEDRLPTHMKLTMEEEMRHLTICDKVMSEKGIVNLNLALCLLNGPPRVGKSTFLSCITGRLSHSAVDEHLIHETSSTGVAERVLQVVIKKASFTIAMAPKASQTLQLGINWQIITLSQEAVMMLKAILSSQSSLALEQQEPQIPPTTPSGLATTTFDGLSPGATSTTVADTNRQPIASDHAEASLSRLRFFNLGRRRKPQHRIPGYQAPQEIFQKALKSNEWASAEDLFKQSLTLYFTDVGGQPEFQEVLPAIIAGPSIFFIVFKLPDHLHQKYKIRYVESFSHQSVDYESSFTVLDSILQSLASIASTCSYVSHSGGKLVAIQPRVVLVGTHKDQTDTNHIRKVQRELKEVLIGTEYYKKGIVVFASPNEPALTINSLSSDEGDACKVCRLVENIASRSAFTVSVPAPWLALLLSFRSIESSVVFYEDCLHMAKDCGINDGEELKEALWFLHTKLGVIRYFHQIPELSDIVICDPQLIFDKITTLIACTFTFEKTRDAHAEEEFKKKGIFSAAILDELSSHSDEPLSGSKLVTLLKHLRIIAPIYREEEEQSKSPSRYLVPCALSHAQILGKRHRSVSLDYPEPHNIPSLCVLFQCGYCPKGIFGALIAELMDYHSGGLRWRLKDDTIYRNQVSFHVGREYHIVKLSFFCTFLEVDISSETNCAKFQQKKYAEKICNDIRLELQRSLISVSRTLHYGHGARFFFGFHCSCCDGSTPAKCDEEDPVIMICDRCGLATDLQDNHTIWYGKKRSVKQVLSINDLQKVQIAAWEARAKWYNIGLGLKIAPGTLDVINRNSDNIDDRF